MPGARPSGVGIGLRRIHFDAIAATARRIDWLEFVPENFVGRGGEAARVLDACRERWPLVPHGVSLSIGGPDPLDNDWLDALAVVLERVDAPYYSDHLCWTEAGGVSFYDLLPLPFTDEAASHLGLRAREVADRLGRELVLENITYYATMPGSQLDEGEFIGRALTIARAGLLLDLTNVWINATNHGSTPEQVLDALPLDRVRHIHLAGYSREGPRLFDNHGSAVPEEVWRLYEATLQRIGPVPTLVEWDTNIPRLDVVLDEADRARAILEAVANRDRVAG